MLSKHTAKIKYQPHYHLAYDLASKVAEWPRVSGAATEYYKATLHPTDRPACERGDNVYLGHERTWILFKLPMTSKSM